MDDSRRSVRLGRGRLLQDPPRRARVQRRRPGQPLAPRLRRTHLPERRLEPLSDADRHLRLRQADVCKARHGAGRGQLHDGAHLQVHDEAGRLRDADTPCDRRRPRERRDRQRRVRVQPGHRVLEDEPLRRQQQQHLRLQLDLYVRRHEDRPRDNRHRPRARHRLFAPGMRNIRQDGRLRQRDVQRGRRLAPHRRRRHLRVHQQRQREAFARALHPRRGGDRPHRDALRLGRRHGRRLHEGRHGQDFRDRRRERHAQGRPHRDRAGGRFRAASSRWRTPRTRRRPSSCAPRPRTSSGRKS